MHNKHVKKAGSVALSAALVLSMVSASLPVAFAADSWQPTGKYALGSAQPYFSGYRTQEVLTWSPETDPYSDYLKASIPLQNRNEAFKPTQANPNLESEAQIMLMQGDYGNAFFNAPMYNNSFSNLCLNFWQYTDYYSPWHGAVPYGTPEALYDPNGSNWQARGFEFGIVNIPNPAYTNAAHKNGVMSIACIFFDPSYRPGQTCLDLLEKDENGVMPVAQQLIDMAEYYGYDGYFINQEEGRDAGFIELMTELRKAGLYLQYYNRTNSYTGLEKFRGTEAAPAANSVFPNYGWPSYLNSDYDYFAKHPEVNPFEVAFYGLENNQGGLFNAAHSSVRALPNLLDSTGNLRASVALFTPSDNYQRAIDASDFGIGYKGGIDENNPLQNAKYQWMIAERERMYFSGVYCDPTDTGAKSGYSRPDVGVNNAGGWVGVADFVSERSVIGDTTFYTNFNTGHGMQYFDNGAVSTDEEWTNISIQDILPTWQWWMDTEGTKLNADFDYGPKEIRNDSNFQQMTVPYTQIGAYDGGSSLVVYGDLDAKNTMHLYKTDIAVNEASKAEVTFRKVSTGDAKMQLGIVLKDNPGEPVLIDVPDSGAASDQWVTKQLDLSAYVGKNIAAIYLVFDGAESGYQMNIGGLRVLDGANYTPAAPTGFTIEKAYASGEMELRWDLADYDTVKQYNVYGKLSDGSTKYLGGIYGDALYVKSLFGEDKSVELELRAVGADGSESAPATLTYTFEDKVSDITVPQANSANGLVPGNAEAGVVDAHWTAPTAGDFDHYELTVTLRNLSADNAANKVYSATADKSATSMKVPVPVGEGYEYVLSICTVQADGTKGEPISFVSKLKDTYSAPMEMQDMYLSGNTLYFETPVTPDWYKIHVSKNGGSESTKLRATSGARSGVSVSSGDMVSVVMEDYAGNRSVPTVVLIENGQIVEPSDMLSEREFPDAALLAAVQSQVGMTKSSLEEFTGTLNLSGLAIADFTGLNLITNMTGLNLSNIAGLETVDASMLEGCNALKSINVSGCTDLTMMNLAGINAPVASVDVSGCTSLQVLDVSGLALEQFAAAGEYPALISVNVSDNKLDLTEGTPERSSIDNLIAATEGKEDLNIGGGELTQVVNHATVLSSENVNAPTNFVDGVLGNDTAASDRNKNASITFDIGSEQTITKWEIYTQINEFDHAFGVKDCKLEYAASPDGPFTLMGELSNIVGTVQKAPSPTAQELATPVTARYFKITITGWHTQMNSANIDWPGMEDIFLYTGGAGISYPAGVNFANQRPAAYPPTTSMPAEVNVEIGGSIDLNSYVEGATTFRGSDFLAMADQKINGVGFIAEDYDLNANMPSYEWNISIIDHDGTPVQSIDTSKDISYFVTYTEASDSTITKTMKVIVGNGGIPKEMVNLSTQDKVTVLYASTTTDQNQKELPKFAFDENESTKWCPGGNVLSSKLIFDIGGEKAIKEWRISHAGVSTSDGAGRNTVDFNLEVLKAGLNPTEEQLQDEAFLLDDNNWTVVKEYRNNTETRTTFAFDPMINARYFRLNVIKGDKSAQWPSTRIYECQVWGYDTVIPPTDTYAVTIGAMENGTVTADKETAEEGETVTLTVTPDGGYRLVEGSLKVNDGAVAVTDNSFVMPAGDVTVTAEFELIPVETYNVTIGAMENGAVTADKSEAAEGETVTLTVTPDGGYRLVEGSLKVNGGAVVITDNSFVMPAGDVTVTAAFELIADREALNNLIAKVEALDEADYTAETWEALDAALTAAQNLDVNATQKQVNAAYNALLNAYLSLELKASSSSKVELETLLEEAAEIDTTNVRPGKLEALNKAIAAAQAVMEKEDASQKEVNEAADALLEAIVNLKDIADREELTNLIAILEKLDGSLYTEETFAVLTQALADAKDVEANLDASVKEIQDAYKALQAAEAQLERIPVEELNLDSLKNAMKNAQEILDSSDLFIASTIKDIPGLLAEAQALISKEGLTQAEVDDMTARLTKANKNARVKEDKEFLLKAIEEAEALNGADYTADSYAAVTRALEAAKKVAEDELATKEQIKAAADDLKAAVQGLQKVSDNPSSETPSSKPNQGSQTGDSTNLLPVLFVMVLGGAVVLIARKRKQA